MNLVLMLTKALAMIAAGQVMAQTLEKANDDSNNLSREDLDLIKNELKSIRPALRILEDGLQNIEGDTTEITLLRGSQNDLTRDLKSKKPVGKKRTTSPTSTNTNQVPAKYDSPTFKGTDGAFVYGYHLGEANIGKQFLVNLNSVDDYVTLRFGESPENSVFLKITNNAIKITEGSGLPIKIVNGKKYSSISCFCNSPSQDPVITTAGEEVYEYDARSNSYYKMIRSSGNIIDKGQTQLIINTYQDDTGNMHMEVQGHIRTIPVGYIRSGDMVNPIYTKRENIVVSMGDWRADANTMTRLKTDQQKALAKEWSKVFINPKPGLSGTVNTPNKRQLRTHETETEDNPVKPRLKKRI